MTALAAAAVWLQPVLLTAVALRVAAGDAEAPWLALGALVAPLIALLAATRRPLGANPVTAAAAVLVVTLGLAADFAVATPAGPDFAVPDLSRRMGLGASWRRLR